MMLSSDGVVSLSGWLVWLKEVYRGARGFELGTLNSSLLAVTMKRQSTKWKDDPMSNADHAIQDLHDILHSYYKVALKRFL